MKNMHYKNNIWSFTTEQRFIIFNLNKDNEEYNECNEEEKYQSKNEQKKRMKEKRIIEINGKRKRRKGIR